MKFGQPEEPGDFDWSLPADHPRFGLTDHKSQDFKIYIGCGKWDIDSWVGPYYPAGTKPPAFLSQYIQLFNSIEVNNTFYRLSRSSMENWASIAVGHEFIFCPKWSQRVTHLKRLVDVEENTHYFIESCKLLGPHLGPTLLQLPDNFTAKNMDRIRNFLYLIPDGFQIFFEFRHKSWFEEPALTETGQLLKDFGKGWALTDVATRRDVLHMVHSIPTALIRFNGYNATGEDHRRLAVWAERINVWREQGMGKVYFFCHHQDEMYSPENAIYFQKFFIQAGEGPEPV